MPSAIPCRRRFGTVFAGDLRRQCRRRATEQHAERQLTLPQQVLELRVERSAFATVARAVATSSRYGAGAQAHLGQFNVSCCACTFARVNGAAPATSGDRRSWPRHRRQAIRMRRSPRPKPRARIGGLDAAPELAQKSSSRGLQADRCAVVGVVVPPSGVLPLLRWGATEAAAARLERTVCREAAQRAGLQDPQTGLSQRGFCDTASATSLSSLVSWNCCHHVLSAGGALGPRASIQASGTAAGGRS
jgi:hypothetical protein